MVGFSRQISTLNYRQISKIFTALRVFTTISCTVVKIIQHFNPVYVQILPTESVICTAIHVNTHNALQWRFTNNIDL